MPLKPLKPCRSIGCPALTRDGYCEKHKPEARAYDKRRGTAAQRGYGARWQRYRLRFLQANPLCIECEKEGYIVPAKVVDHIKPHKGDKVLFWEPTNHQGLCAHHHSVKTAREDGGFGNFKGSH